jgi:hypothetical protein
MHSSILLLLTILTISLVVGVSAHKSKGNKGHHGGKGGGGGGGGNDNTNADLPQILRISTFSGNQGCTGTPLMSLIQGPAGVCYRSSSFPGSNMQYSYVNCTTGVVMGYSKPDCSGVGLPYMTLGCQGNFLLSCSQENYVVMNQFNATSSPNCTGLPAMQSYLSLEKCEAYASNPPFSVKTTMPTSTIVQNIQYLGTLNCETTEASQFVGSTFWLNKCNSMGSFGSPYKSTVQVIASPPPVCGKSKDAKSCKKVTGCAWMKNKCKNVAA